jgi:hypothetical protein
MKNGKYGSPMNELPKEVQPYIKAMLGASGLREFDAITSVLFAIATHMDLKEYPILTYLGARATGKSAAMKQLYPMCKDSKWIGGATFATHRDAVKDVRTVFVDEADLVDSNAQLIDLYTRRYLKETGTIDVNVRGNYGTWEQKSYDIFGATVMAKRTPISDVALRSRAITIHTAYQLESYDYTDVGSVSHIAASLAGRVEAELAQIGGIDRVYQTWSSLLAIANQLGMSGWRKEAENIIVEEAEALAGGQGYEPSDAVLQVIDIRAREENNQRKDISIKISEIVPIVREEFALTLRPNQVEELAKAQGFEIGRSRGYRTIKVRKDLLDKLLPEEG